MSARSALKATTLSRRIGSREPVVVVSAVGVASFSSQGDARRGAATCDIAGGSGREATRKVCTPSGIRHSVKTI